MGSEGWPLGLVGLADLLGVAPQRLYALAKPLPNRYIPISIPKRKGGFRHITIPTSELKGIQRLLTRHFWSRFPISTIAHGYVRQRSTVTAATLHLGKESLLKIDLADFFPSITAGRVYGFLRSHACPKPVAWIVTNLVSHEGALPQGAPTSPMISNAICYGLDSELRNLARSWRLTVTRYSDDIAFSGSLFNWKVFSGLVAKIVERHGFLINPSKTQFATQRQGQKLLGLVVNGPGLRLSRRIRRTVRSAFFRAGSNPKWALSNAQALRGYAEYHRAILGANDEYKSFKLTLAKVAELKTHDPKEEE